MKRITLFLLTLALLLPLFVACAAPTLNAPPETVEETASETKAPPAKAPEKVTTEEVAPLDPTPLTNRLTREKVEAIPLATADMTAEERRQLSLDFVDLQLSFHWIPGADVKDYPSTYGGGKKMILTSKYYCGVPYQSKGTGNLYRWLEYYDEETAILDLERIFAENGGYGKDAVVIDVDGSYKKYRSLMVMFNQCSVSTFWGWGRVINSARFVSTAYMNVFNGFIPVGGYTYPNMTTLDRFGEVTEANPDRYDTTHVIRDWNAANGSDAMYRCYAQMRPADLLVSTGHTLMVESVTLEKNADGSVNYEKSYATVQEQTEAWDDDLIIGGVRITPQGRNGKNYSFKTLQSKKYIPFTFAEYLDPANPEDQKYIDFYNNTIVPLNHWAPYYTNFNFSAAELNEMTGMGLEKTRVFTNVDQKAESITYAEFETLALGSNYTISDVFVTVTAEDGKVVKENIFRALTAYVREVTMKSEHSSGKEGATISDGIKEFADGKHTVTVTVQLSTGEKPTVYSGTLLP